MTPPIIVAAGVLAVDAAVLRAEVDGVLGWVVLGGAVADPCTEGGSVADPCAEDGAAVDSCAEGDDEILWVLRTTA